MSMLYCMLTMRSNVSLVMDIRVSPHRDIEAFKGLLDDWITEAGPGCSMRFIHVRNISNYSIVLIRS